MGKKDIKKRFNKFSHAITLGTGSPVAFIIAFLIILLWGLTGPFFGFSNTWQLVINTSTTIITFLMVFIIQHSQNKDTKALHIKLDILIKALEKADNKMMGIEDLTDEELKEIGDEIKEDIKHNDIAP